MKFGPKRGHALYIFDHFFKDFGLMVIAIALAIISGDMVALFQNAPVVVVVLFGPIARVINYLCTYYSIDNEKLFIESGWLTKKKLEIPVATITTVDFSQNVLQQIFNVYKIKIDNASNIDASNSATKVNMTLKQEDAIQVRALLGKGIIRGLDGFNAAGENPVDMQNGTQAEGLTQGEGMPTGRGPYFQGKPPG